MGGQDLFKIFVKNLFLTLGGGESLFNNADPTYCEAPGPGLDQPGP